MSMMIVAKNKDINPWIQNFKEYNKDIDIQIYPDIEDKDTITFALVWSKNDIDFTQFKNLKCISSMGAGIDHILCNTSISKDIYITKIIDTQLVNSMWEYLLTSVMNVVTNHYKYIFQKKDKIWNIIDSIKPIKDTTITLLGLGQIGSYAAQSFANMNFKVKGYSRSKKEIKNVTSYTILEESIKDSDIIINLLPLTKETEYILNSNFFAKVKKGAYIINVGRGKHLKEEDLLQAINEQKLSGATLDVFDKEPLSENSPLWNNDKIIITPHSASITNPQSVTKQIMTNYSIIEKKGIPHNIVDAKKGY
ncbi:MAG: glyoxylate/hydroxypyruvate reductase A [Arcobacter sp.]|nr:MAG: glyoxylate/hydroxypyruvate reductase A [Arcobacter sp.]